MAKYSFVVLHYNSIEDTNDCIDSIKDHCGGVDYRIYIVDNASPNGSGPVLAAKYSADNRIRVVLSGENLGFAKGNNLGIAQARNDGYADFVVVINNDIKVIDDDFCGLIESSYNRNGFAVLGPTIYTPRGKTAINPGRNHILCGGELDLWESFYRKGLSLIRSNQLFRFKLLQRMMRFKIRLKSLRKPRFRYTENCVLHGCCLIFSSFFFEKFDGFDDRTFLYFEEEILYAHVMKAGLKMVYEPSIKIWHKEDGATDSVFGDNLKKTLFVYEKIIDSIQVYKRIISE